MPKRTDLKRILVIGSGPIVIGQACEFDYSGTQACKALRAEGLEVVLVNSNPATIMTDPELAERTYIEPLTADIVSSIIERERPDALLPTVGGQTALNLAVQLEEQGVLRRFGVELIGASVEAIKVAEDRQQFRDAMRDIGIEVPNSRYVKSMREAFDAIDDLGYPVIVRPSFTLGGGRVEHPVRCRSRQWTHRRDRDEPARLTVLGARVEGHRVSNREDRREARARLHARRDPERHHAPDPRVVRAHDRLRRRQGAAVGVREIPARRPDADDADEVGRRGDGDRADVQGIVHE